MKALSIRQPWAWLIAEGIKDVENRTWRTPYHGPLLIHAAKGCSRAEYEAARMWVYLHLDPAVWMRCAHQMPGLNALNRGGFVAVAELVECIDAKIACSSPWFEGPIGFVLRNAQRIPFTPWRGQLGFFEADIDEAGLRDVLPSFANEVPK